MPRLALTVLALALAAASPVAAECRFTLNFDFGSARLELADSLLVRDLARRYPNGPVALTAHADDDGTEAQNRRIARARAEAVMASLHRSGLRRGQPEVVEGWKSKARR